MIYVFLRPESGHGLVTATSFVYPDQTDYGIKDGVLTLFETAKDPVRHVFNFDKVISFWVVKP